jgi:inosine-uridine nucleoside N-ribohydrolase
MLRISALLAFVLTLTTSLASAAPHRIPIILDTDIGGDIDDAFALALVMNSPEFDLLGVTTVSADTSARARIAAKMLWEAGGAWRKVPVAAGIGSADTEVHQAAWARDYSGSQILREGAADFLRQTIRAHPNQVTVVAIGPLTNLAAMIRADPRAAHDLKQIVLMGGSIGHGYGSSREPAAEWNIKSDPRAAQVVFTSGIPILMAPLDVTAMLQLNSTQRRIVFARHSSITNSLAALYALWKGDTPILFDPMAVVLLLKPSLCQMEDLAISVDDNGDTLVQPDKPPNARVGISTNPDEFIEFYVDRVTKKN